MSELLFSSMTEREKNAFRKGQEIVVAEFLNYIAELEESRNEKTSYGKGQLYILRELVHKICEL